MEYLYAVGVATGAVLGLMMLVSGVLESLKRHNSKSRPMATRLNRPMLSISDPTPRQLEVLRYSAKGFGVKAIAGIMGISYDTAKFHITNLRERLGASNNTEALAIAIKRHHINLDEL